jgi:hypothetical protein
MTNQPTDDDDLSGLSPEQLHALAGVSDSFAVARRLICTIYTAAEDPDGGDSLARVMLEIADGDPVAVAVACATEAIQAARQLYGDHTGQVLALRAARQMTFAEHRRDTLGGHG